MQDSSEQSNLIGLRQGRQEACEAIIRQHYKTVYRFMAYLSRDTNLAEDLTQETFAYAWANIASFKARASLGTWLHKIAYNKFVDSRRILQRDAALIASLKKANYDAQERTNPLARLLANEHSGFLYEAIQRLESSDYLLIVLHYIQGLSFREMAEVLDKPTGTIKWEASRALNKLRSFLTEEV